MWPTPSLSKRPGWKVSQSIVWCSYGWTGYTSVQKTWQFGSACARDWKYKPCFVPHSWYIRNTSYHCWEALQVHRHYPCWHSLACQFTRVVGSRQRETCIVLKICYVLLRIQNIYVWESSKCHPNSKPSATASAVTTRPTEQPLCNVTSLHSLLRLQSDCVYTSRVLCKTSPELIARELSLRCHCSINPAIVQWKWSKGNRS